MTFKEHTKKNWLITFFAAIFAASVVVMIFFDEPSQYRRDLFGVRGDRGTAVSFNSGAVAMVF